MIQVFYDKINTLFDGLENDQKLEIYGQLSKKLGISIAEACDYVRELASLPTPMPHNKSATKLIIAPKKKWSGKLKGVTYQEVTGYDPSQKSVITRLLVASPPKSDHSHISDGHLVIVKHGYKPYDRYFVCAKHHYAKDWKFFGSSGDKVESMVKRHDDFFEKWKDMADYCDNYFNS